MKLLTWDTRKEKQVLVGNISGDTLFRNVFANHFMRLLNGYGIQEVAFQEAIEMGVKWIVEKVSPTGDMWRSSIKDWKLHGRVADYGHGKQRFLSMKFMSKYSGRADFETDLDDTMFIAPSVKSRLSDEWRKLQNKKQKQNYLF